MGTYYCQCDFAICWHFVVSTGNQIRNGLVVLSHPLALHFIFYSFALLCLSHSQSQFGNNLFHSFRKNCLMCVRSLCDDIVVFLELFSSFFLSSPLFLLRFFWPIEKENANRIQSSSATLIEIQIRND